MQMYIKCLLEKHTKWSKHSKTIQVEDESEKWPSELRCYIENWKVPN